MTKKLDPDRPNKARRGRPRKYKNPNLREGSIRYRASPEGKAAQAALIARNAEERKLNPMKFSRVDIPNGMTRATAAPLWAEARRKADRFMNAMAKDGFIPEDYDVLVPESDEAKGVAALDAAVVLALGPTDKQLKLAAIRTVLEYTRSKPASKSEVKLSSSEALLAELAAENDAE